MKKSEAVFQSKIVLGLVPGTDLLDALGLLQICGISSIVNKVQKELAGYSESEDLPCYRESGLLREAPVYSGLLTMQNSPHEAEAYEYLLDVLEIRLQRFYLHLLLNSPQEDLEDLEVIDAYQDFILSKRGQSKASRRPSSEEDQYQVYSVQSILNSSYSSTVEEFEGLGHSDSRSQATSLASLFSARFKEANFALERESEADYLDALRHMVLVYGEARKLNPFGAYVAKKYFEHLIVSVLPQFTELLGDEIS